MHTFALTWQQSAVLAALLAPVGLAARRAPWRWMRVVAPFAVEIAIVSGLYSLWQLAGELSIMSTGDALQRARDIELWERWFHLPSERDLQPILLHHPLLAEPANLYYATMHFTGMLIFLVWLFVWHRDRYPAVRTTMALTTAVCLLVQLWPVAPPRMLPGFVDVAELYGQSVYGNSFGADQLSAMPSVHIAWAVLIAWYVMHISTRPWRWIGPVHAALTVFVVVATANHFWADGIVGVAIFAGCALVQGEASRRWQAWRAARAAAVPVLSPAPEAGILQ